MSERQNGHHQPTDENDENEQQLPDVKRIVARLGLELGRPRGVGGRLEAEEVAEQPERDAGRVQPVDVDVECIGQNAALGHDETADGLEEGYIVLFTRFHSHLL